MRTFDFLKMRMNINLKHNKNWLLVWVRRKNNQRNQSCRKQSYPLVIIPLFQTVRQYVRLWASQIFVSILSFALTPKYHCCSSQTIGSLMCLSLNYFRNSMLEKVWKCVTTVSGNEHGGCTFYLSSIWIQNMFKHNAGFCFSEFLFFLRSKWMFTRAYFYTNSMPFMHPPLIDLICVQCSACYLWEMQFLLMPQWGKLVYDPTVLTYFLTMNSVLLANTMLFSTWNVNNI